MLKSGVGGEELFILLLTHLIHVEVKIDKDTAIIYIKEQPYLMEAQFRMELVW